MSGGAWRGLLAFATPTAAAGGSTLIALLIAFVLIVIRPFILLKYVGHPVGPVPTFLSPEYVAGGLRIIALAELGWAWSILLLSMSWWRAAIVAVCVVLGGWYAVWFAGRFAPEITGLGPEALLGNAFLGERPYPVWALLWAHSFGGWIAGLSTALLLRGMTTVSTVLLRQRRRALAAKIHQLRFVTLRCEVREEGLRAIYESREERALTWRDVSRIAVRQLPSEPPWDSAIVVDFATSDGAEPLRLLTGELLGFQGLPRRATTSPAEDARRLCRQALSRNPSIELEELTRPFVLKGDACPQVRSLRQFQEYDARYD